jgi:multidrug efflux pump subunit AcrB
MSRVGGDYAIGIGIKNRGYNAVKVAKEVKEKVVKIKALPEVNLAIRFDSQNL